MYSHTYIFTSSRGKALKGKVDCESIVVVPGGKLRTLCNMAFDKLKHVEGQKLVYFVAGIPDICSLERDRMDNYEESYLKHDIDHVQNMKSIFHHVQSKLEKIGCEVVFATITTMSFEIWNGHRMSIRKTRVLKHQSDYAIMQERLNKILHELNSYITSINSRNQMVTPFLHAPVHKCRGGKLRYLYSRLVDGVHPTPSLATQWVERIQACVKANEENLINRK